MPALRTPLHAPFILPDPIPPLPSPTMTVTLAFEFAPEAAGPALHALRQPALAVESLDLWRTDIIATLCSDDEGPVQAALAALALCPGVRVAFVGEG